LIVQYLPNFNTHFAHLCFFVFRKESKRKTESDLIARTYSYLKGVVRLDVEHCSYAFVPWTTKSLLNDRKHSRKDSASHSGRLRPASLKFLWNMLAHHCSE